MQKKKIFFQADKQCSFQKNYGKCKKSEELFGVRTELSYNKKMLRYIISNRNQKNTETHEYTSLFTSVNIGNE